MHFGACAAAKACHEKSKKADNFQAGEYVFHIFFVADALKSLPVPLPSKLYKFLLPDSAVLVRIPFPVVRLRRQWKIVKPGVYLFLFGSHGQECFIHENTRLVKFNGTLPLLNSSGYRANGPFRIALKGVT